MSKKRRLVRMIFGLFLLAACACLSYDLIFFKKLNLTWKVQGEWHTTTVRIIDIKSGEILCHPYQMTRTPSSIFTCEIKVRRGRELLLDPSMWTFTQNPPHPLRSSDRWVHAGVAKFGRHLRKNESPCLDYGRFTINGRRLSVEEKGEHLLSGDKCVYCFTP